MPQKVEHLGADKLRVQAVWPAKGVAGNGVKWSDNMLDLLPGDAQIITAYELGEIEMVRRLR